MIITLNKSRCWKNKKYYISGHHNLQTISTSSKVFCILELMGTWIDEFDPCGVWLSYKLKPIVNGFALFNFMTCLHSIANVIKGVGYYFGTFPYWICLWPWKDNKILAIKYVKVLGYKIFMKNWTLGCMMMPHVLRSNTVERNWIICINRVHHPITKNDKKCTRR